MKKNQSIRHFTGREQQALLTLKNKIVKLYRPLIIYLIGCNSVIQSGRNIFGNPKHTEGWAFSCTLLLVLPDGNVLPEDAEQQLKRISEHYWEIRLLAHPFDFVKKQLEEYSLFFCWTQRRAIVLYERDRMTGKLPEPVQHMKQYEKQVHEFFANNSQFENYLQTRLAPLPKKAIQKKENTGIDTVATLSPALQNKIFAFLQDHGAGDTSFRLRQALLEYIRGVTQTGIPLEFNQILWDFEELMEFFDLAAEEGKQVYI